MIDRAVCHHFAVEIYACSMLQSNKNEVCVKRAIRGVLARDKS